MLNKPILFFDLETTSADPETARIVQIAYKLLQPDGDVLVYDDWLVNPGVPIEPSASEVHGITNEDVEKKPSFKNRSGELFELFSRDVVIGGYNSRHFDEVILEREMIEAGFEDFDLSMRPSLDVYVLISRLRPRTLAGVVKEVLGEQMEDAHDAGADTRYTMRVAEQLFKEHREEVPKDAEGLNKFLYPDYVDRDGKLRFNDEGEAYFTFGKLGSRQTTLRDAVRRERQYIEWMLGQNFPKGLKKILINALNGVFPERNVVRSSS